MSRRKDKTSRDLTKAGWDWTVNYAEQRDIDLSGVDTKYAGGRLYIRPWVLLAVRAWRGDADSSPGRACDRRVEFVRQLAQAVENGLDSAVLETALRVGGEKAARALYEMRFAEGKFTCLPVGAAL